MIPDSLAAAHARHLEEVFFVLRDSLVAVRACSCGSEPPLVRPHRRPQGSHQGPPEQRFVQLRVTVGQIC